MGSLILVGFVCISIFAIVRSRNRVRTALAIFVAMVAGFVGAMILGRFAGFSGNFVGSEFGLDLSMLCGMLAALIHSRRSRTKITSSTSRSLDGQP
jgi:hypothetical protein